MKSTFDKTELYYSKAQIIAKTTILFAFVIGGLAFLYAEHSRGHPQPDHELSGYALVVFLGLMGLASLIEFFNRKPAFILDKDGLYFRSILGKGEWIAWEAISDFRLKEFDDNEYIVAYLWDNSAYLNGVKGFKEMQAHSNISNFGSPIRISPIGLEIKKEELLALLLERLPHAGSELM